MAHLEKYKRGSEGHMFAHFDRTAGNKIGNENVDLEKSHLNYNLAEADQPKAQIEFLKSRLAEDNVKVLNRKDVNTMADWLITAPASLSSGELETFFQESYIFLKKRYGVENVVSSYVHLDETTPHMHFSFVPIVPDKKSVGQFKLSFKECCPRSDYQSFHIDLNNHMTHVFGRDIGILTGLTTENKTISQLKKESKVLDAKIADLSDLNVKYKKTIIGDNVKLKKEDFLTLNYKSKVAESVKENYEAREVKLKQEYETKEKNLNEEKLFLKEKVNEFVKERDNSIKYLAERENYIIERSNNLDSEVDRLAEEKIKEKELKLREKLSIEYENRFQERVNSSEYIETVKERSKNIIEESSKVIEKHKSFIENSFQNIYDKFVEVATDVIEHLPFNERAKTYLTSLITNSFAVDVNQVMKKEEFNITDSINRIQKKSLELHNLNSEFDKIPIVKAMKPAKQNKQKDDWTR